jgi:hypothetical protein
MNVEHKEFIGIYRQIYVEGYCEHLISEFNRLESNGAGSNRQQSENASKHVKDDYQIGIAINHHNLTNFNNQDSCNIFFEGLQTCYDDYTEKYSVLKTSGKIRATVMKMQRTGAGGWYHVWHSEQGEGHLASRVMTYLLYLNTLPKEAAGETEFLYQKLRINPEANMMILCPAGYTHAHRGNPVLTDDNKYIVTGWFYYD